MKFLVCGPRYAILRRHVHRVMDALLDAGLFGDSAELEIIDGVAIGTDNFAHEWARSNAFAFARYPINDEVDGEMAETAPKRRNQRMLDGSKPDCCLGFPGHGGTNDMMSRSQAAGVTVWEVEFEDGRFRVREWGNKATRSRVILEGQLNEPGRDHDRGAVRGAASASL